MNKKEKRPNPAKSKSAIQKQQANNTKVHCKKRWVLERFICGDYLNYQSAQEKYGDASLYISISALKCKGAIISRGFVTIQGYNGLPAWCFEYAIKKNNLSEAQRTLGGLK